MKSARILLPLLSALLAAVLILPLLSFSHQSDIQITAHRGDSSRAPENTLPAIESAIACRADFVEVDVQETKDGVLVLLHDGSVKRTSDDTGTLHDLTYEELLSMDFGSWFSEEFQDVKIPTLKQALEVCRGRIRMNIELKSGTESDTLTDRALELIEETGMEEQVVISSVSYQYLKEVKEKNPRIPTGYILSSDGSDYYDDDNIDFFSICSGHIDARGADRIHAAGKALHIWTINTANKMKAARDLGADNIITDCPSLAERVL